MLSAEQTSAREKEYENSYFGIELARDRYDISIFEAHASRLIESHPKIEHDTWLDEPELNARSAIFEELTAKGHLSEINFGGDVDEINSRILQRLLNAWSDNSPRWEQARRFREIVEELFIQQAWQDIKSGELPDDTIIFTLSDYPEVAAKQEAHAVGYRELNQKGMVRGTYFMSDEQGEFHRMLEQISRSNSSDQSSKMLFQKLGCSELGTDTSLWRLSNQLLASREKLPNGTVDIQRELDRYVGADIRYGENIHSVYPPVPEYGELRIISAQRESRVESHIKRLADFERAIDKRYKAGEITYSQKLHELQLERKKIVNEICILEPSYAYDARGAESAGHFEKTALAMAAGNDAAGMGHFANALATADPMASAVCGGGGINGLQKDGQGLDSEGRAMYLRAKEDRKNWKWSKGYCLVKVCPTQPKKAEVGPCSVCKQCQLLFDKGKDPEREYIKSKESKIKKISKAIIWWSSKPTQPDLKNQSKIVQ